MSVFSRLKHLWGRIEKETALFPSRRKEYGLKVASATYLDGLIPPGKHPFYIRTVEKYVDGFMQPIVEKYRSHPVGEKLEHKPGKVPVWCCWWQGVENMPELVRMCNDRLRSFLPEEAELRMVTAENYRQYVELPPWVLEKFEAGKMSITALSDILRAALLAEHGGFWIDSTVFISHYLPKEFLREDYYSQRMYDPVKWKHEACKGRWCGFLMGGKPGNVIFCLLRDAFYAWWKEYDSVIDYVILDYFLLTGYKNVPAIREQVDNLPDNNPDVFEMYKVLHLPYTPELYEKLTATTNLHKLTYKIDLTKQTPEGAQTLYAYLLRMTSEVSYGM